MTPTEPNVAYQFGTWIVEPHLNRVRQDDEQIQLEPKTSEVLECLLGSAGEIVSIDHLLSEVWKDRVVEPSAVHRNMTQIRRALKDSPKNPQYIETIPKRGYRTTAPVTKIKAGPFVPGLKASLDAITPPFPAYDGDEPYTFVCYSHKNREVVYRELQRLRGAGINLWYDEGIAPGAEWEEEIAQSITRCEHFLFFVSPDSVTSSFCLNEVQLAQGMNRSMVVTYLEPTTLRVGLQLSIGRIQALHKYQMRESDYARKVIATLTDPAGSKTQLDVRPGESAPRVINWRLKSLVSAGILAVVITLLAIDLRWFRTTPTNSIVVGRFEDLSPNVDQQWIGGSIMSEVRVVLPSHGFQVVGGRSQTEGDDFLPDARYLLQGSVMRMPSRVRVTAELISTEDQHQLWAEVFEQRISVNDSSQEKIAGLIAAAVSKRVISDAEGVTPTLINVTPPSDTGALQSLPIDASFPSFPTFEEESDD